MTERRIRKRNFNYITILRGIATLGITFFHLFPQRIKGGFLGVVMFFVMSGFLMMRNLDMPKTLDNKEKLQKTLTKRFSKLLPPLYSMMVLGLVVAFFYSKAIFTDSVKSTLPVAFGYQNIYQILAGGSYFQRNGNFSIFTHLWYIALQIQYILIFYIINFLIEKYDKKKYRKIIFGFITIISFISMYVLAIKQVNITRIYYGPDTRMSALFLGALLYLESSRFEYLLKNINEKTNNVIIFTILFITVIPFFFIQGESYFTYRFFMIAYTFLVGALVLLLYLYEKNLVIEKSKRTKIGLVGGFLYYLGSRSYHIYLWQYVVQIFFAYSLATKTTNKLGFFLIEMLVLLILSEISFNLFNKKIKTRLFLPIMIFLMTVMVFASNFVKDSKDQDMKNLENTIDKNKAQIEEDNKKALEVKNKTTKKENKKDKSNKKNDNLGVKDKYDFNFTEGELFYLSHLSVTAIGDSVLININSYLRKYIPNLYLDGEVGRNMTDAPKVLKNIKDQQGLGPIVIVALGSNGNLEADDFDQIMEIAKDSEVLFVNTSHTQPWQDYVNNQISKFCDKTKNAYLIDWYSYAKEKPNLFAQDLVHPNVEGSKAYANIVARALLNTNHASENK